MSARLSTCEDQPLTIGLRTFALRDTVAGETARSVLFLGVPSRGKLQLDGVAIAPQGTVPFADIAAGRLVYVPDADGFGSARDVVSFRVNDGASPRRRPAR